MERNSLHRPLIVVSLTVLLTAVAGCGKGAEETPAATRTVPRDAPSPDELAKAVFDGILEEPVQLVDGNWHGEPFVEGGASAPAVGLVKEFHLAGDLTGDANDEAVSLLWTSSGGSGTFDYLAVTGRTDAGIETLATAELGDRVQVRRGQIADSKITLEVLQAGPEDAACCPTELATRVWTMGPEGLEEVSSEVTGTMSVAELRGPEWVLTDFAWNEPAPSEPEVTLAFEEERVVGNAGCNGYFGSIEPAADMPNGISFGPLGSTRMMCPEEIMAVEDRYLRQLAGVTSYSYLAGRLALSWQDERSAGVMIFTPRAPVSTEK